MSSSSSTVKILEAVGQKQLTQRERFEKVRTLVQGVRPDLVPDSLRISKSKSRRSIVRYKPERRAVLRQEAEVRGLVLSDEVMRYMLNHFSRDLGSLMQWLDHLDHYALQTQRALTIPLVRAMLENA